MISRFVNTTLKNKVLACMLAALLLVPGTGALAQEEIEFTDLRALAPEGTFLPEGSAPEATENSYKSANIAITIEKRREYDSDVYVADIYLADVSYLKRAFSHEKWGANAQKPDNLVEQSGALLAITGDYSSLFEKGLVVANGEVIRQSANRLRHNCLIYPDGRMETFGRREMDVERVLEEPVWQSFLFGPELLDEEGKAFEKFDSNIGAANPRSVIGYYAPGHYCFVLVDGRGNGNKGMKMTQLSNFMESLGCMAAYNLDGGQSAVMVFMGRRINRPYHGGRSLNDMAIIAE